MARSVLWLAGWYPSRVDRFNGDFIERQAVAVSQLMPLTVLVVLKDPSMKNDAIEIDKTVNGQLTVYRVYYGKSKWGGILEKFSSYKKFLQLQKQLFADIVKESGIPGLVHVHIAMKAGLLASFLKRKYNIPYVITEHWTGYYHESVPNIYKANFIFRKLNKQILKNAALLIPVSKDLGETINNNFVKVPYEVIPNVVNTNHFFYQPPPIKRFRFIHPSYMNYQKNPEGILNACLLLKNKGIDFEVLFIGADIPAFKKFVQENELSNNILFKPAVTYTEVAKEMQQSSALLLFSRFENMPCVILEALCCGLPVISSRVGGIEEVIDQNNGILVRSEQIEELANAMETMILKASLYDRNRIATKAIQQFSYETVASKHLEIYEKYFG